VDPSFRLESLEPRLLLSGNGLIDEAVALTASPSETATLLQDDQADQEITVSDQKISSYDPETQLSDLFATADSKTNPEESNLDGEVEDPAEVVQTSTCETQASAFSAEISQSSPAPHLSEGLTITDELVETLNAAEPPPGQGGVFVFTATSEKNDLTLRLNTEDHSHLEVFNTMRGEVVFSQPLTEVDRLLICGSDEADDTLTVDFSIPFWLDGGISFDGGAGGFDSLIFNGTGGINADYNAIGADAGMLVLSSASGGTGESTFLQFTGLEPVTISGVSSYTFRTDDTAALFPGTTPDDLTGVDYVVVDCPEAGKNRITGISGGVAFESVTFFDVADITIDLGANDTQDSNTDSLIIAPPGLVARGLQNFTIKTGDGADIITVQATEIAPPFTGLVVTIDTGAGEDYIDLSALTSAAGISEVIGGFGTQDTLAGPSIDANLWTITGLNEGFLQGVLDFREIENIVGADGVADTFLLLAEGSIEGILNGGGGGPDSVVVQWPGGDGYTTVNSTSDDPHAFVVENPADPALNRTVRYAGIEPIVAGTSTARIVNGSATADEYVYDVTLSGGMKIANAAGDFYDPGLGFVPELVFASPASILFSMGAGDDSLTLAAEPTGTMTYHGGAGSDALAAWDADHLWTVDGTNNGTLDGTAIVYLDVESLVGGAHNDTFVFTGGTSELSVGVDGGSDGYDLLDYSAVLDPVEVRIGFGNVNIDEIRGAAGTADTLVGGDDENLWTITGTNAGLVLTRSSDSVRLDGSGENATLKPGVPYEILFASPHGLEDGQEVTYQSDLAVDTSGLAAGQTYIVRLIDEVSIVLETAASVAVAVDMGAWTTGSSSLITQETVESLDSFGTNATVFPGLSNGIEFKEPHGYAGGEVVRYESSDADDVSGLTHLETYIVQYIDEVTIALETEESVPVPVDTGAFVAGTYALITLSLEVSLSDNAVLPIPADSVRFLLPHGLVDGEEVIYQSDLPEPDMSGLDAGTTYNVIVVNENTIQLETTGGVPVAVNSGAWTEGTSSLNTSAVTVSAISFSGFENLTGNFDDDTFIFADAAGMTGGIDGGEGVDSLDFSEYTTAVTVNLGSAGPATTGAAGGIAGFDVLTGGSSSSNVLLGPDGDAVWDVTGTDAGKVNGIAFSGFQNLTGAADNEDGFILRLSGSISGTLDGGAWGRDNLAIEAVDGRLAVILPEVAGSGTLQADGIGDIDFGRMVEVNYLGLERAFDASSALDLGGTVFSDTLMLTQPSPNTLRVEELPGPRSFLYWSNTDGLSVGSPWFELDISGVDRVVVDLGFGDDSVTIQGDIDLGDRELEVRAERIVVSAGSSLISTADIKLLAKDTSIKQLEDLIPGSKSNTAAIEIHQGAQISADNLIIRAEAADKSLTSFFGTSELLNKYLIDRLFQKVMGLFALPFKVLIKRSEATVTIHDNVILTGSAGVIIEADAGADASAGGAVDSVTALRLPVVAKSKLFSFGYVQTTASAIIDIQQGVQIVSPGGPVAINADGKAVSLLKTETSRDSGDSATPAVSLAIAKTDIISKVTVAESVTITAGKTANITAEGREDAEAEAKAGIQSDGSAGLALGISLSDATITVEVNGTVTANMAPGSVVKLEFDPTQRDPDTLGYVDTINDTILVGENALSTGDRVTYSNRRGTSIAGVFEEGGLTDGDDYYVITTADPTRIKLAETRDRAIQGMAIDLELGSGPNEVAVNSKEFEAGSSGVVDSDNDTITLDNPRPEGALIGSTFELGQAVRYDVADGDTPIEGLIPGNVYYVIASTNQFNLEGDLRFVDEQVIQLAESENEARAGIALDLDAADATGTHKLTALHVLDSELATGLGVIASLEATDKALVESGIEAEEVEKQGEKDEESETAKETSQNLLDTPLLDRLLSGFNANSDKSDSGAKRNLQVAGALSYLDTDHTVTATVGPTAVLKSNEDLEVKAEISDQIDMKAETSIEKAPDKAGDDQADNGQDGDEDDEASGSTISAAVAIGLIDNTALATVESGAELDALRALRVISGITYPFLTRPDEFIPMSVGELVDQLEGEGIDGVNDYLDGTLGLQSKLFNTWVKSTGEAGGLSIAGSVNFLDFKNVSEAVVRSGARINQDTIFRAPTPESKKDQQVVSIEATNYMQFFNVTGTFEFKLPSGSLDPLDPEFDSELSVSPMASKGEKGGLGGAVFIALLDNTTTALVEADAAIYSGSGGGFNMKAEEAIVFFSFSQAGAQSDTYAVGGTVAYFEQASRTRAQLSGGAQVSGGTDPNENDTPGSPVTIYAGSLETHINWAGGVAMGRNLGFGITVAINDIDRDTSAVVGNVDTAVDPANAQTPATTTSIDASGPLKTDAKVDGDLWAFSLAAAIAGRENPPESEKTEGEAPVGDSEGQKAKYGIGISANVSINTVEDDVYAYVHDAGVIEALSIELAALNRTEVVAWAAAVAAVLPGSKARNQASIAGSFSKNVLTGNTGAFIKGQNAAVSGNLFLNPGTGLNLNARREGDIQAISAGIGVAVSKKDAEGRALIVAGSVSLNEISNTTVSSVIGVWDNPTSSTTKYDVTVQAQDESSIFALAGALSLGLGGGNLAVGFSLAMNTIQNDTLASVDGSHLLHVDELTVLATNRADIQAITVSGALGAGDRNQIVLSGAVSINTISAGAHALIAGGADITTRGNAVLKAADASSIRADGGGIALGIKIGKRSGGAATLGIALAFNEVSNFTTACVDSSTLDTGLQLVVSAESKGDHDERFDFLKSAVTSANEITLPDHGLETGDRVVYRNLGVPGEEIGGLENAVRYFVIRIDDDTIKLAATKEKATAATPESVDLITTGAGTGDDHRLETVKDTIGAFTIAGAGGGAVGKGTTGAFAAAGAGSLNQVNNTVAAFIKDSVVQAGGDVSVMAHDASSIDVDVIGASISLAITTTGSAGALSVGVSIARNEIDNTVDAYIENSTVTTGADIGVRVVEDATISATSVAASIGIGGGKKSSLALSGGGAEATNVVLTKANAFATESVLVSYDAVEITTISTASIDATVVAVSLSVSVSTSKSAAAVSIGVSVARNFIGWDPRDSATSTYETGTGIADGASLQAGMTVKITDGPRAGDVFEYNGSQRTQPIATFDTTQTAVSLVPGYIVRIADNFVGPFGDVGSYYRYKGAASANVNLALLDYESDDWEEVDSIDLHTEDYSDYRLWKQVNLDQSAAEVQAYAADTSIDTPGALAITASSSNFIDALSLAGSVGVSGGGKTGVGASGAGVFTQNQIKTDIKAYIDGSGSTGISAGSIELKAHDSSAIVADAGAASLAVGLGGKTGAALSIGLSMARNEVGNEVAAFIRNAPSVTTTGDIAIHARTLPGAPDPPDYLTTDGEQMLSAGETVRLPHDYANGGEGGRLYAYRGYVADYTNLADYVPSDGLVILFEGDTVKLGDPAGIGMIYRFVGDDLSWLNLATTDYDDDDLWEPAELELHEGNTVQVGDFVYRYKGEDDDFNLGITNYWDTGLWELINPDRRNLGIENYSDTKLWELADGTITTRAGAASIGIGLGAKGGVAISGAGAIATNVILSTTNAYIENSTVLSSMDVDLDAENSAVINATVAALSVALGAGGKAGVGVSIGVSIAKNFIGWDTDGNPMPVEVQAYIRDSSITATGSLTLDAISGSSIDAIVLAGSAAIAAGGKAGVGLSGAGVSATNRIATHIKAFIDGDDQTGAAAGIRADDVTLHASDTSSIQAIAGAATIAAAFGGKAGVALSVGVALAENHIGNEVEAYIAGVDDGLETAGIVTPGNVVVDARTVATIDAITAAASVAIGAAGTAGIAISGAGAVAKNVILTRTNAFIGGGSVVLSAGNVDIHAMSDSAIDAIVVAVSGAVGIGGTAGIGASVGFALARNFIGWDPSAPDSDYTTAQELKTIPTGTRVRVLDGVRGGDVYQYIGPTADVYDFTSTDGYRTLQNNDDRQSRVKVGYDIYVWEGDDGESVNLSVQDYDGGVDDEGDPEPNENWRLERLSTLGGEDFGDPDLWKLILPQDIEDASQVQAYIMNSNVTAVGDLTIEAVSKGSVDAFTLAGSVAIGAGGTAGIALSGAGVGVENRVRTLVKAFIDGSNGITANNIHISARDHTRITADAGAASIAGSAAGTVGISLSVGIAVSFNEVSNVVAAYIANAEPLKRETPCFSNPAIPSEASPDGSIATAGTPQTSPRRREA